MSIIVGFKCIKIEVGSGLGNTFEKYLGSVWVQS